ncbi:MAG: hypothetical protein K6B12_01880, partial [Clostridiales bacterium]|nr:hypothetical protein [Clostridiales bacterium]
FDFEAPQTIGDLLALEPGNMHQSTEDNTFYYGMEMDGSYYRFKAEMTQEQRDALFNIDYAADDAEEQENAILSDLVITDRQKLDDQILSQEDLDALVGKTGQELLDAGWTPGYGYDLEAGEFMLFYGPFCYTIGFDGEFEENDEIFNDEDYFKDRTVTSAAFYSMGDIANW